MSEPTQRDRERAKVWAREMVAQKPLHYYEEQEQNMARVLLALLAEREAAWPTEVTFGGGMRMGKTAAIKALNEARASGRRAGLLELAEWCDRHHDAARPYADGPAWLRAASHARAMAEAKDG